MFEWWNLFLHDSETFIVSIIVLSVATLLGTMTYQMIKY